MSILNFLFPKKKPQQSVTAANMKLVQKGLSRNLPEMTDELNRLNSEIHKGELKLASYRAEKKALEVMINAATGKFAAPSDDNSKKGGKKKTAHNKCQKCDNHAKQGEKLCSACASK